jgi:Uma2 family endonuclease
MAIATLLEKKRMTAEEYLKMEREGIRELDGKYEFYNNQIQFMAGSTPNHNSIHKNAIFTLEAQIREKEDVFDLYHNDIRVVSHLSYKDYFYPDIIIVKGKPYFDDENNDNLANPKVVIEVLSDSTEAFDRGDKFKSYRKISSLEEYILINQKDACIEQFYRDETGRWQFGDIITEGVFQMRSLPFILTIDQVYRKIDFSAH